MMAFRWVWKYAKKYNIKIIIGFILVIICSAMNMVAPYLSGTIVDRVIMGKESNILIPLLGVITAVILLRSILRYIFLILLENMSQDSIFDIRNDIYSNLQKLDFDFFDKTSTGDIMNKMTGDIDAVRHFLAWVGYNVLENSFIFLFGIAIMFSINYKLTLILLMFTPPIAYFARKLAIDVKPTFFNVRQQFSKLNSVAQENISGNRVVKAFAKEEFEIGKFGKENDEFRKRNIDSAKVWRKYLPIIDSLSISLNIVIILIGGIMVINQSITIGNLVTFNAMIFTINNPMRMAGWLINDIQRFSASGEKIIELMNTKPKIKNSENQVEEDRIKGNIEFKNVNFNYGDEEVLENINLKVSPGQTIAIIGHTGSGKSTFVSLLCRFYECTKGEILIDGYDIKDFNLRRLRKNIAVAMQDIFLFSDTIEGNIAYGLPTASMDEVRWAAGIAGADDFINKMEEGYDTIVGERGVGLSGGQKQRISLARALLKNPSIIILDDTTSSLDIQTENNIRHSLDKYFKDKTTFIIAHRISSVKNADMILVLNNGRIVERGTHSELLVKKGEYYNVYINQFGNFDDAKGKEVG
ncbi:ABC transporter ATP-binding protein/permease [Clostridium estertheticum]|uniref:Multidrug ABC transporter ATP-binding protein n=2 Tax=Clostridium estertheticum TaxID=238834 RepID=A0A1J0GMV0_9CLOT|nr:ABC transporter ATP-binding protein [Clostridium estertheticum]APC42649.1 multidrug ABC transporter ATP-binding protein [Clostridium estertheticum subsp. estertheticum]MBU3170481.1 ABC transporter ATP-binding protein/permease [Clostridium estertheticum]MBZ9617954.1 ABC transporter ATP-binding protein/permease [Clostridium estertheticum subsp. laramiense]WAG76111.1 ABC transporter ATP-binding protein/permease [Clostridium estertheticum]